MLRPSFFTLTRQKRKEKQYLPQYLTKFYAKRSIRSVTHVTNLTENPQAFLRNLALSLLDVKLLPATPQTPGHSWNPGRTEPHKPFHLTSDTDACWPQTCDCTPLCHERARAYNCSSLLALSLPRPFVSPSPLRGIKASPTRFRTGSIRRGQARYTLCPAEVCWRRQNSTSGSVPGR